MNDELVGMAAEFLADVWGMRRVYTGDERAPAMRKYITNCFLLTDALAILRRDQRWAGFFTLSAPEGCRNDALTAFAGRLFGDPWIDPIAARTILHIWNLQCRPPLGPREVDGVANSILKAELRKLKAMGASR